MPHIQFSEAKFQTDVLLDIKVPKLDLRGTDWNSTDDSLEIHLQDRIDLLPVDIHIEQGIEQPTITISASSIENNTTFELRNLTFNEELKKGEEELPFVLYLNGWEISKYTDLQDPEIQTVFFIEMVKMMSYMRQAVSLTERHQFFPEFIPFEAETLGTMAFFMETYFPENYRLLELAQQKVLFAEPVLI